MFETISTDDKCYTPFFVGKVMLHLEVDMKILLREVVKLREVEMVKQDILVILYTEKVEMVVVLYSKQDVLVITYTKEVEVLFREVLRVLDVLVITYTKEVEVLRVLFRKVEKFGNK